ncbi:hypothetical protein BGZ76_005705 [Entomortierella beljakovae]|nr:hypothetical protein BGZ76_005705 [Entomortierella beljakovae]
MPPKRAIIFTDEELDWIRGSDSVSPGLYFEKFRSDSQNQFEEHQRYSRLLDNGNFEPDCMNSIRKEFDSWKINNAPKFWLDRRTRAVTMRTAGKLVEGSEPFAFQSIDRTTSKILEQDQDVKGTNEVNLTSRSLQREANDDRRINDNNTLRSIAKEHEECCIQRQGRMSSQDSSLSQLPIKNSVEFHTATPINTTIPTNITIEQTCDILTDAQNMTHEDLLSDGEDKERRCNETSRRESFPKDKAVSMSTIKELGNQLKSRKRHRGDNTGAVEPSSKGDIDFKIEKEKQDTKRLKEGEKTKRSTEETERARISLKQKEVELEILKVQLQLQNNGQS